MKSLVLYSTSHCHLCEMADTILRQLTDKHEFSYDIIEISDDNQLLKLYELKIPVLKRLDNDEELNWPFDSKDVSTFLI